MPVFDTPTPIDLAIDLPVGSIAVHAGDRTDTVVTVSPSNPARAVDRRAADETRVAFDGSTLTITGPKPRFSIIGPTESVEVTVEVPSGSRLTAEASVGGVRTTGVLGATRVKNTLGAVELETTGDLWVRAGHGDAVVREARGDVEITADHGQIKVGSIGGGAGVGASHGTGQVGAGGGAGDAQK